MPGKVKKIKHRGGKKLNKLLRTALKGSVDNIEVGFFESARYQDGTQVAYVAAINEFGADDAGRNGAVKIPERPFFRIATRKVSGKLIDIMTRTIDPENMIVDSSIAGKLGVTFQNEVQLSITNLTTPPNSPVTIAKKKKSNPLINSGDMRKSVTYKVNT